jgi:hypothetical protein
MHPTTRANAALILAAVLAAGAARAQDASQGQPATPAGQAAPANGGFALTDLEVSEGVDYSVGRYGASADTTIVDFPLDLKAQLGPLRLEGTLPYDYVKGPGELVGGVVVPTQNGTSTARWGLGDLTLQGAYLLNHESGLLPAFELSSSVKLPTARAGIGTGETDYSAGVNLYKSITPKVLLFGSVGYSWLGSMPNFALRDGATASGGVNFKPTATQNLGISIAYRDPVARGFASQAAISPYLTQKFGKHWGVTLYGTGGLTDASPRYGAGLRLTVFR